MDIRIRPSTPADAKICAGVCYEAFRTIAAQHNFPSEIPSLAIANTLLSELIANPSFYGIVAELDGRISGSAFVATSAVLSLAAVPFRLIQPCKIVRLAVT